MNIVLRRFGYTPMGTFGRLVMPRFECYTLEEVWADNARGRSCIPVGTYTLKRGHFPKHGNAFEVMNVPGRSAILIHPANTVDDIEGCIGPGEDLGYVNGKWAVTGSRNAYNQFMDLMAEIDAATLEIVNDCDKGIL